MEKAMKAIPPLGFAMLVIIVILPLFVNTNTINVGDLQTKALRDFSESYSEEGYVKVYRISESAGEGLKVLKDPDNPHSICDFLQPGDVVMVVEESKEDDQICYRLANDDGFIITSKDNMVAIDVIDPK